MPDNPLPPVPPSRPRRSKTPAPAPAAPGGDAITGSIGSNARGAAIGKNIFQSIIIVGDIKIPVLPVLALILLVLGIAVFFGLRLLGPDQMSGSFNLAVAEFGQLDGSGRVLASAAAQQVSRRLYEGLKIEFDNLPAAEKANFHPQVWHDSLDISQKRVTLGVIPGDTPQARFAAACALAARIRAHGVIYGNLPSGSTGTFTPEFAICDNASLRLDSDEITGAHQLIEGLPASLLSQVGRQDVDLALNLRINSWTRALSLFSMGILYDLQGRSDLALGIFQQARDQLRSGNDPASEVLWFFIGREELILAGPGLPQDGSSARAAHLENARAAFLEALRINPAYARARIGLAGVHFTLAQDVPAAGRLSSPDLAAALQEYQQAAAAAPASAGALLEVKARLGLAATWILQGEAQRDAGQLPQAADSFNQAVAAAEAALQPLQQAGQPRLLAQAYLTLGEAYHQQGHLRLLQGDPQASRVLFEEASRSYSLCVSQKEAALTDQTLAEKIVAGFCAPYKKVVDASLAELGSTK